MSRFRSRGMFSSVKSMSQLERHQEEKDLWQQRQDAPPVDPEASMREFLELVQSDPLLMATSDQIPGHRMTVKTSYYTRKASCSCGWGYWPRFGQRGDYKAHANASAETVRGAARRHARYALQEMMKAPPTVPEGEQDG